MGALGLTELWHTLSNSVSKCVSNGVFAKKNLNYQQLQQQQQQHEKKR